MNGRFRLHALGITLVELMISLTLGLVITAGLIALYVNMSRASTELDLANRQMENGRFAVQLMRDDLWHAGFWGEYLPPAAAPTAVVDPCLGWAGWSATDKVPATSNVLRLPVQGANDASPGTCNFANRKAGTDVLVVRHADTCVAGVGGCEDENVGKLYLQVSLCSSEGLNPVLGVLADLTPGTLPFDRHMKDCVGAFAGKRKFVSNIYYVRDDNALVRSEFGGGGGATPGPADVLVEGVEQLQVEYAIDTNVDGDPDSGWLTATQVNTFYPTPAEGWQRVVAVKLHILARNSDPSPGPALGKTYNLGGGVTFTPTGLDARYKRHVFTTAVRLVNPAQRRHGK